MLRRRTSVWLGVLLAGALALAPAVEARSSGGYSRPGGAALSSSNRPSLGGGGGYARPSASGYSGYSSFSGGDRAISRGASGDAFRAYRTPPAASSYQDRRPSAWGDNPPRAYATPSRGPGLTDTLLLWSMLNSIGSAGRANYFYNNQNDPGYGQWRADADRQARTDPAVAAKLAELDEKLAQMQGQPRTPGPPPAASDTNGGEVILVVLLLGGGFFVLWLWRRRAARDASAAPSLSGSARTRFRVGMVIPLDPSPFLLASGHTKVRPPDGSGTISVEAVGLVQDGAAALHRLYLPGRAGFFLLHLDADGAPDECRYFSALDEITPADAQEWGAWLDPAEGMIGWPQFQTKDGRLYDRAWAPGPAHVAPRTQTETLQDSSGATRRTLQAMLYAAPTNAPAPAPATEYILACAIDSGRQAWVEIHAGIDINPAALSLPAVAL